RRQRPRPNGRLPARLQPRRRPPPRAQRSRPHGSARRAERRPACEFRPPLVDPPRMELVVPAAVMTGLSRPSVSAACLTDGRHRAGHDRRGTALAILSALQEHPMPNILRFGTLGLCAALPILAHAQTRIDAISTQFRWLGPNDKIVVERYDDPKVAN